MCTLLYLSQVYPIQPNVCNAIKVVVGTLRQIINHQEHRHIDLCKCWVFMLDKPNNMLNIDLASNIKEVPNVTNSPQGSERQYLLLLAVSPKLVYHIGVWFQENSRNRIIIKYCNTPDIIMYTGKVIHLWKLSGSKREVHHTDIF